VDLGPLPEGISGDEVWIDIHLRQQVLVLYRGATPQFATMVSSGAALPTPVGMFRIYDKYAYGDMEGRPDADYEPYLVENVPWVMHFAPRYALHGAFWHWGFGHVASHGCVNLAPKDAQRLYEAVSPERHEGWLASMEAPEDPGTLVRIRRDNPTPRDRRKPLQ
jgi:lipoprotein-anchoring transpeptidase ErfK/SrfK